MTTTQPAATPDTVAPTDKPMMRRVAMASLVGTTVEFYDFFIFGTAAALVFSATFFPALGDSAASTASLATFGVAFVARPFGAILFGHFGDKIGRKATLVTSLLLMGSATVAIGLLPSADTIGVAAPIALVVLRLAQGLAVGGEWAGAVLLTAENAPVGKRGAMALFPQLGPAIAFVLTSATFLTTSLTMSNEQFLAYGWRIPFIASAVLVAFGLFIRLKLTETPAFKAMEATDSKARVPFFEVVVKQPLEVALAAGAIIATFAFFHTGATYLTSYGTTVLGLERSTVLTVGIVAGVAFAIAIALSAVLSDRMGRRSLITFACVVAVPWSLVLFPLINTGSAFAFGLGVAGSLVIVGIGYGPFGAHLPELFKARYRYTGAGVAYALGGLLGGAIPPLISNWLVENFGGNAIGYYLALMALISLACVYRLKETSEGAMDDGVEAAAAPAAAA